MLAHRQSKWLILSWQFESILVSVVVYLHDLTQLDIFPLGLVEEYAIGCLIAYFTGVCSRFHQRSNMEL